ncbi:hypothetical protein Nocox_19280 [Nonomuraea coxensis DSM 45129]|uniref:Uncharacterized protein n=1 Tax=Nonomuraea coxensis DSM 45129 TaxID=1122611 RepID=A0ABX8U1C4_9ACTN|nr:hypothetical protein Nocox_19280 [Nonomuraea coxensis DSM 45129]
MSRPGASDRPSTATTVMPPNPTAPRVLTSSAPARRGRSTGRASTGWISTATAHIDSPLSVSAHHGQGPGIGWSSSVVAAAAYSAARARRTLGSCSSRGAASRGPRRPCHRAHAQGTAVRAATSRSAPAGAASGSCMIVSRHSRAWSPVTTAVPTATATTAT